MRTTVHPSVRAAENATGVIRQHADVVRGHDAVHPDRNECGGVGGCLLMRAEHDAETAVTDSLIYAARHGYAYTVTAG